MELVPAGATVYTTGRSTARRSRSELIEAAGGMVVALGVDHLEADEVAALIQRIESEHGRSASTAAARTRSATSGNWDAARAPDTAGYR